MKKILLALSLLTVSAIGNAQNCPQIISANIIHLSGNDYRLVIIYQGNGTKHLNVSLFSGPVVPANFLSSICLSTHGNGSANVDFTSAGVSPVAIIVPGTGSCNSQSQCDPTIVNIGTGGPLPILIGSFYAKRNNTIVTLSWNTLMEINSREFIVQRNTGEGFIDLQTIQTSTKVHGDNYNTTDKNTYKGTTLYRLKLIDKDGTFSFSDVRLVKGLLSDNEYVVFPNPTYRNRKVMISDITEPTNVQIIDNAGRIIKSETIQDKNLDVTGLPKGSYLLKLVPKSSGNQVVRKLLINE